MKKQTEKRGRKKGMPVYERFLEDLFTALGMNGRQLSETLDISPSLVVYWKHSGSIEPKHLRVLLQLLERVKVVDADQRLAWKRVNTQLAIIKNLDDATGSANPVAESAFSGVVDRGERRGDTISLATDKVLIDELRRRGWDVSTMLLTTIPPKDKK